MAAAAGYDLGCDIQTLDSSVRDADCGVRTGIVREKERGLRLELVSKNIFADSSPGSPHNRPFLEKRGANRLFGSALGPRELLRRETRDRFLREEGPHGRFRRAAVLLDRIPHALAKCRFATRPATSSSRLRVLRPCEIHCAKRIRRLRMRPKRSPLNRAWSRCPVIIVSSTYITCSARGVQQHTLSVKSTGRVEKRAGVGKNWHHHRDRDGRIALGRSTPDISRGWSQIRVSCPRDRRSYPLPPYLSHSA